jgi:hypothetical protein
MTTGDILLWIFGNWAMFLTLFIWNRSESRADIRHMDTKLESNRDLVRAIHDEIKDFHNRLCKIEGEKR